MWLTENQIGLTGEQDFYIHRIFSDPTLWTVLTPWSVENTINLFTPVKTFIIFLNLCLPDQV
jgi:hypothetical protein